MLVYDPITFGCSQVGGQPGAFFLYSMLAGQFFAVLLLAKLCLEIEGFESLFNFLYVRQDVSGLQSGL